MLPLKEDSDKLKEVNNLRVNVFELFEDKNSTQLYVSENMNKDVVKVNDEIYQMSNHEDNLEDVQQNIYEDSQKDNNKVDNEKFSKTNGKTTGFGFCQDHFI